MRLSTKRYLECTALFFILPGLLYFCRHLLAFRFYYLLILIALMAIIYLIRATDFDRYRLWRPLEARHIRSMAIFFLPAAALIGLGTYVILPSKFLAFPKSQPLLWLLIMVVYPLLLVLPQEMLFRCFFFQRYRILFENYPHRLVVCNAISFSLFHLFYGNWVAPLLSFCGGLLFAWRYQTTQSLLVVSLEHALWGNYLFTIGIGWYFYSGSIT